VDCVVHLEDLSVPLKTHGGEKPVTVKNIKSKNVWIETRGGSIHALNVDAKLQTYVTNTGALRLVQCSGEVSFRTQSGEATIEAVSGVLRGRTFSGRITLIGFDAGASRALLDVESTSGDIDMKLPGQISAEFDLNSGHSPPILEFSLRGEGGVPISPSSFMKGRIRDGVVPIRASTEHGQIWVRRG